MKAIKIVSGTFTLVGGILIVFVSGLCFNNPYIGVIEFGFLNREPNAVGVQYLLIIYGVFVTILGIVQLVLLNNSRGYLVMTILDSILYSIGVGVMIYVMTNTAILDSTDRVLSLQWIPFVLVFTPGFITSIFGTIKIATTHSGINAGLFNNDSVQDDNEVGGAQSASFAPPGSDIRVKVKNLQGALYKTSAEMIEEIDRTGQIGNMDLSSLLNEVDSERAKTRVNEDFYKIKSVSIPAEPVVAPATDSTQSIVMTFAEDDNDVEFPKNAKRPGDRAH